MKWTRMLGGVVGVCLLAAVSPGGAVGAAPSVTCRVELDRGILPAGSPQRAVIKVTLDAPVAPKKGERAPINLAVVLDRSGSMSGEKIEKAKDAAIEILRRLGPSDLFSLVVYDDRVETIVPAQSAANTEWIEARIRGIRAGNSTALFSGVSQGASEVRKNLERDSIHRILLLSDGLANVGPSSPDELGRLGAALLKEHISVTTVGVGTDYNEDLMARLSQNSDGNTYFVENSRDLPRIFTAELGDVLSVVARQVRLEIDFVGGVRPLRLIGRDGRIRDNQVEIYLNQLYGGQQKYVLVEVEIPAGMPDREIEVAKAHCAYENAITRKSDDSAGRASARFSIRQEEVDRSVNEDVQTELVRNSIALAKDKAIALADEGKTREAAEVLKKESQVLKALSAKYNVAAPVAAEAAQMDDEGDKINDHGMSSSTRKSFRAWGYQIKNQQLNQ